MSENCGACKFKEKYDRNPDSLLGRLWRWHINWCPGWRRYLASLDPQERKSMITAYGLKRNV